MPVHVCPVCGIRHEVSVVLHSLAYGRAFNCSPKCKAAFGPLVRRRILAEMAAERSLHVEADLPALPCPCRALSGGAKPAESMDIPVASRMEENCGAPP